MLKRIAIILGICSIVILFAGLKSSTQAKYYRMEIENTQKEIQGEKTAINEKKKLAKHDPQEVQKIFEAFSDKVFQAGQFFGYNVITKPQKQTADKTSIISSIQDSSIPGVKMIKLKSEVAKKRKIEPLIMFRILNLFKKFPARITSIDFSRDGTMKISYELYGI